MLRKLIPPISQAFIKTLKVPSTQNQLKCMNVLNYNTDITTITFNSNFSPKEEKRILSTINEKNNEELGRYNISQSRIKKIQNWKSKMGPFKSLHEILEVDGFSEKILKQICNNIIINENVDTSVITELKPRQRKPTIKQLIIPGFDIHLFQMFNCVTGIYISSIGISWARICRDGNTLTHWNMDHFHELPKKMSLIDTFKLATNLVQRIPPSDIYVFESIASLSPTGQQQSVLVSSHNQQQDLTAMLLTLLNTSSGHNMSLQSQDQHELQEDIENKVYFIKSKLPARLFSLLIGNEKVSNIDVTSQLLKSSTEQNDLPCSPIQTEFSMKKAFEGHATTNKELLGQALLIVVTFMNLFVYDNSNCWSVLSLRNKKNR